MIIMLQYRNGIFCYWKYFVKQQNENIYYRSISIWYKMYASCKIYFLIFLLRYQKLGCHAWPYSFKFNAKTFLYELRLIGLLYTLSEKRVVNRALICFTHSQDIINAQILLIIHNVVSPPPLICAILILPKQE